MASVGSAGTLARSLSGFIFVWAGDSVVLIASLKIFSFIFHSLMEEAEEGMVVKHCCWGEVNFTLQPQNLLLT